jgi:deoxyribonuclease-4
MKTPELGMHVSAAGGAYRAIANGESMGATAIQFFGASPRSYAATLPTKEDAEKFREAKEKSPIKKAFMHAAYLVNLSSEKPELRERSIRNLAQHLRIAEAYGCDGLIFHPGSYGQQLPEHGLSYTAEGMKAVLEQVPGTTRLLIENTAGGGTKLGGVPEEIAAMLAEVNMPDRTGCCLDTAHAFESGIIEDYADPEILKAFLKRWDATVGFARTYALHVNDSKTAMGSNHDQHENLGDGYIGIAGFEALASSGKFNHAAWMLEVPGMEGLGPDQENLERLKACFA